MLRICSGNECQIMPRGAWDTWSMRGTLPGIISRLGPSRSYLVMPPWRNLYKRESAVWHDSCSAAACRIFYTLKITEGQCLCKYYLKIFLLLFDRSWREAMHLDGYCIFAVSLNPLWGSRWMRFVDVMSSF